MRLSVAALPSDTGKLSPQVLGQGAELGPKGKQRINQHQQHTSRVSGRGEPYTWVKGPQQAHRVLRRERATFQPQA